MHKLFAVFAALAAVALIGAAQATADGAQVFMVPFKVTGDAKIAIAACVGEPVAFTDGEFNVVIHSTPTEFTFHRNVIAGVGVGTITGTTYHATGHLQVVDVLTPAGGETFTFELTLNVVGQGNAGHFTAHSQPVDRVRYASMWLLNDFGVPQYQYDGSRTRKASSLMTGTTSPTMSCNSSK